jgi:hypothetical protein
MIDYSTFTEEALLARLTDVRQDHLDLDAAIAALVASPLADMMLIGRLKRKKLALKEEYLNPDIIA